MPYSLTNPCGAKTRNDDAKGPTCTMPAGFRTDHVGEGRCYLHGGRAAITHGRYSKIIRQELKDAILEQLNDPDILNMEQELAAARALFVDYINRYEDITAALLAWHQSYREVQVTPERLDMLSQVVSRYEAIIRADDGETIPAFMKTYTKGCRELVNKYKDYYNTAANFKPHKVLEVEESYRFLAEITKIVERIEKVRAQNAISRKNFVRVMNEMGRVVNTIMDVMGSSIHFFDVLGHSIKVYDAAGNPIDIQQVFQEAKEKIQQQWSSIRVE